MFERGFKFQYNDGGRNEAGWPGDGDSVTRAIAIASGLPYATVYQDLDTLRRAMGYGTLGRQGVPPEVFIPYLKKLGFSYQKMHTKPWMGTTRPRGKLNTKYVPARGTHIVLLNKGMVATTGRTVLSTTMPGGGHKQTPIFGIFTKPWRLRRWARRNLIYTRKELGGKGRL